MRPARSLLRIERGTCRERELEDRSTAIAGTLQAVQVAAILSGAVKLVSSFPEGGRTRDCLRPPGR